MLLPTISWCLFSCYTQVGRMRGRQVLMLESGWNRSCGTGCLQSIFHLAGIDHWSYIDSSFSRMCGPCHGHPRVDAQNWPLAWTDAIRPGQTHQSALQKHSKRSAQSSEIGQNNFANFRTSLAIPQNFCPAKHHLRCSVRLRECDALRQRFGRQKTGTDHDGDTGQEIPGSNTEREQLSSWDMKIPDPGRMWSEWPKMHRRVTTGRSVPCISAASAWARNSGKDWLFNVWNQNPSFFREVLIQDNG